MIPAQTKSMGPAERSQAAVDLALAYAQEAKLLDVVSHLEKAMKLAVLYAEIESIKKNQT